VVQAGWWPALEKILGQKIDYIGQPQWHDYLPGEIARIQKFSWYTAAPLERRQEKLGVSYMSGSVIAARTERLREAHYTEALSSWQTDRSQYPNADEVLLGAIAQQHRWTRATFEHRVQPKDEAAGDAK